jgi:hypothetical protein
MKIPIYRSILLLTAIAFPLYAQQTFPLVGPRPSQVGDEKIVKSPGQGYLRVYTPQIPLYDEDGLIGWDNDNYRIIPGSWGMQPAVHISLTYRSRTFESSGTI